MACRAVCSISLLRLERGLVHRSCPRLFSARSLSPRLSLVPQCSRLPASCEGPASARRGRLGWSHYSTSSSGGGEEEREEESGEEKGEEEEDGSGVHQQFALAPVSIPDVFPEVPVLPISRNPIFPKFVKMLEVSCQILRSVSMEISSAHRSSDKR